MIETFYEYSLLETIPISETPSRLLRINVSEECNLNCMFCCWKSTQKENLNHHFSIKDYLFILKVAIETKTYKRVMLTGGEPLMLDNKFLFEFIKSATKFKKKNEIESFWICSNGTLLKEKALLLSEAGLQNIDISIAANSDIGYETYTKSKIKIDEVLEGISEASKHNIDVRLAVPVYKGGLDNYKELLNLINLTKSYGAKSLGYFKLHKTNNNAYIFDKLVTDVNPITKAFTTDCQWHQINVDGQIRMVDKDGFQIIIPCQIKKATENCKSMKCGDYCQGTYASYINGTKLQKCHRTFSNGFNSIDIKKVVIERDYKSLANILKESSNFS
ncbi:radical SAM protein [Saccharicrinis sp. FJH2]|uniref:radical SAM protein n=1 Tax=Saccharicrinis sp. FJH65 TaxID=3344659 RepID=UPI0035F27205